MEDGGRRKEGGRRDGVRGEWLLHAQLGRRPDNWTPVSQALSVGPWGHHWGTVWGYLGWLPLFLCLG